MAPGDGEKNRVGGEGTGQENRRLRTAVYSSCLRLPLGNGSGQVHMPVPRLEFFNRWQGARGPGATAARPVSNQAGQQPSADRRAEAIQPDGVIACEKHSVSALRIWMIAPACTAGFASFCTRRFRPPAAGTRFSAA